MTTVIPMPGSASVRTPTWNESDTTGIVKPRNGQTMVAVAVAAAGDTPQRQVCQKVVAKERGDRMGREDDPSPAVGPQLAKEEKVAKVGPDQGASL